MHVYEIRDKEMHEEFLKYQNLTDHIVYVQKMFEKCLNAGIINKGINFDAFEFLLNNFVNLSS